jgi:hypothetical protein
MILNGGIIDISFMGQGNSLLLYSAPADIGTGTWSSGYVTSQAAAYSAPSMLRNGSGVDIGVQGPDDSLDIYWGPDGSSTWTPGTVAGDGTTYSQPALVVSGNGVDITAAGPNGSLYDYWAENGTNDWSFAGVALPGSVA